MVARGYKDTEIGVIPIEWDVVELGNILTILRGASPRPINEFITENENGISWIKIGDIQKSAKYLVKTKQKITIEGAKKSRAIQPKDFILSNSMSFGRPYISKISGCIHDGWLVLRNKNVNNLSNNFLYEILSSDLAKKQFKRFAAGSTVNNLKSETVSTLKIPLPPLKEQEQIADILSTADEKIDAIDLQIQKAEILKKGLLQKLLSEGIGHSEFKDSELGKIPESWETSELEKATTYVDYRGKTPTKTKSGVFLITARNIKGNKIDYNLSNEYIAENDYENVMSRGKPKIGDVLLTTEAPLGEIASIDKEYVALAQRIIKYRGIENYLDNNFLKHYFISSRFQGLLLLNSTGSTVKGIKGSRLKKLRIAIPPLKEQKQIASILSTADEKLEVLRAKKQMYETLKKGLLQKLLSGEIRV